MTTTYVVLEDKDSLYIDDGEAQDNIKKIFDLRKTESDAKKECGTRLDVVKEYPKKYIDEKGNPITKYYTDEFNVKLETRKNNMAHDEFVRQLILLLPAEYVDLIPQAVENAKLNAGTQIRCTVEKR